MPSGRSSSLPPELRICFFCDFLILTGCAAVAPELEEVMGQAHQPPFALDLRQPAQAETAETTRPLDLAEHRLPHALPQTIHGAPSRRPQFRPHLLLRRRPYRQWCCRRGSVVFLPLRRQVGG